MRHLSERYAKMTAEAAKRTQHMQAAHRGADSRGEGPQADETSLSYSKLCQGHQALPYLVETVCLQRAPLATTWSHAYGPWTSSV